MNETSKRQPRRFTVRVGESESGWGILWPGGKVTLYWRLARSAWIAQLDSPEQLEAVLAGDVTLDWIDPDPITTDLRRETAALKRHELVDLRDRIERALEAVRPHRNRCPADCICTACHMAQILLGGDR